MTYTMNTINPMKPTCYRYPHGGMAYGSLDGIPFQCTRRPGLKERA